MALLDTTFLIDLMKETKQKRAGKATAKLQEFGHGAQMMEKSAEGARGFLLFAGDRPVFRVYDPLDRTKYTDYAIRHDDLEVQIVGNYASLFEGDGAAAR